MDPRVQRLIVQAAVRHGVDPEVALRTAMGEGGVGFGAVGDHGTSFGPFQLHIGGASPYSDPAQAASFANSPQGIDYALAGIAKYARGLRGAQGVAAAVKGFERPANPSAEISRDLNYNLGAGSFNGRTLGSGPSDLGSSPSPAASLSPSLFGGSSQRMALAMSLFQQAANDFGTGSQGFDPGGLLALALSRRTAGAAQQTFGPPPTVASVRPAANEHGYVLPVSGHVMRLDQGVDVKGRPGAPVRSIGAARIDAVKNDPGGFGKAVYYTLLSGPHAGQQVYVGHAEPNVQPGDVVAPGAPVATLLQKPLGNATQPGWTEIGFARGGVPQPGSAQSFHDLLASLGI